MGRWLITVACPLCQVRKKKAFYKDLQLQDKNRKGSNLIISFPVSTSRIFLKNYRFENTYSYRCEHTYISVAQKIDHSNDLLWLDNRTCLQTFFVQNIFLDILDASIVTCFTIMKLITCKHYYYSIKQIYNARTPTKKMGGKHIFINLSFRTFLVYKFVIYWWILK